MCVLLLLFYVGSSPFWVCFKKVNKHFYWYQLPVQVLVPVFEQVRVPFIIHADVHQKHDHRQQKVRTSTCTRTISVLKLTLLVEREQIVPAGLCKKKCRFDCKTLHVYEISWDFLIKMRHFCTPLFPTEPNLRTCRTSCCFYSTTVLGAVDRGWGASEAEKDIF